MVKDTDVQKGLPELHLSKINNITPWGKIGGYQCQNSSN